MLRSIVACIVAGAMALPAAAGEASSERPLRLLFIGNSYTYVNDLPNLVAQLAASARPPRAIETEFVGEGGATLKRHWEAGRAREAIRKGKWDYVILQEQGTLGPSDDFRSISDPAMFHEYARFFDAEIAKAGAKTLLFMTWARADAPEGQAKLADAYTKIAGELKALVAPVGIAWQNARSENPKLALYDADRSHPAPAGSYLTACVFYSVLFSQSPEGAAARGDLSEADAALLQRVAWRTVKEPLASAKPDVKPDAKPEPAAEAAPSPEAIERGRAILAAAQKSAGGIERLRALRDIVVTLSGTASTPMGEVTFEGRDTLVFPMTLRSEQKLPFGNVISFFDGRSGWRTTPQGVMDVPDRMKKVLRGQIARNSFNVLRDEGESSVHFESHTKVGEREADVIAIRREDESVRLFVEPASGVLLKKAYQAVGMGGPADFEETYSDYREVSGIAVPFRVELTQNGAPFLTVTVQDVKFDSGVDPAELAKRP